MFRLNKNPNLGFLEVFFASPLFVFITFSRQFRILEQIFIWSPMYQVLYVLDFQFCEFLVFAFSPLFCTWSCFLFQFFFFLFVCGMVLWSCFKKTNKLLIRKLKMNFCLWHVFLDLHKHSRNNRPCKKICFFQAYYNYPSFVLAWFSIFMCKLLQGAITTLIHITNGVLVQQKNYYFDFLDEGSTFVLFN